jgi:hypothetical protein
MLLGLSLFLVCMFLKEKRDKYNWFASIYQDKWFTFLFI